MSKTVSIETAEALRKAGFPQPEPIIPTYVYFDGRLCLAEVFFDSGEYELSGPKIRRTSLLKTDFDVHCTFAPTALDILEQLTGAFLTKKSDGLWQCSIKTGEGRAIFNSNTCPHEACAKTWIEWVNRNNEPNF